MDCTCVTLYCFVVQFDAIHQYIANGGNVLFMLSEGGEAKLNTNVNFFLEEYGVMVNPGQSDYRAQNNGWPQAIFWPTSTFDWTNSNFVGQVYIIFSMEEPVITFSTLSTNFQPLFWALDYNVHNYTHVLAF